MNQLIRSLQSHVDVLRVRNEPRWEAEKLLRAKILAGTLVAEGVQVRPEISESPTKIAAFFFEEGKIQWHRNSVEFEGRKFIQVAISRPANDLNRVSHAAEKSVSEDKSRRNPGPPSGSPVLIAEYERMLKSGDLVDCNTIKEIWNRMLPNLEKMTRHFPGGRGLKYSTFARSLSKHIRN